MKSWVLKGKKKLILLFTFTVMVVFLSLGLVYKEVYKPVGVIKVKASTSYRAPTFESKIEKKSLFSLIKKSDPKKYTVFIGKLKKAGVSRINQERFQKYSAELVSEIFPKYLSVSPDHQIYKLLQAQIIFYKYLYKVKPSLLVDMELQKRISFSNLNKTDTLDYMLNIFKAKEALIKFAIKNPVKTPTKAEAAGELNPVLITLIKTYGKNKVADFLYGRYNNLSNKDLALMFISFYKEIYKRGEKSSGIIMRYIGHEFYTK